MRFIKLIFLTLLVTTLVSCGAYQYATAEKGSDEATTEQQQEVKNQVMKLLKEEYKQPFKLEDFSYKYERHWVDNSCQMSFCEMKKYGTYYFKVKAVNNPIIELEFDVRQVGKYGIKSLSTIKDLIDFFKKNQLKDVYCLGLSQYYKKNLDNNTKVKQPETREAEDYCRSRGFPIDKTFFVYTYKEKHNLK